MVIQAQAMDRGALGTPCGEGITLSDLITLRNIQFLTRLGYAGDHRTSVKFTESKLPGGKNDRS